MLSTYGSLFTGIGGLDLGFDRLGFACRFQVEISDYATRVLERHWPGVPRWGDIWGFLSTLRASGAEPPYVDILCGGLPCQPVSMAGNRKGASDERWLWEPFRGVIEIIGPRYVVIENVPGLLSADSGRLFGGILRDLASFGYDAEWEVLPAAAFGLPHLRKRLFVIAHSDESRLEERQDQEERQGDVRYEGSSTNEGSWRSIEPTVCGGYHGVPSRVDRIKCLGNAVVPPISEWIAGRILDHAGAG